MGKLKERQAGVGKGGKGMESSGTDWSSLKCPTLHAKLRGNTWARDVSLQVISS